MATGILRRDDTARSASANGLPSVVAFQAGGTLTVLMALVLMFKAYEARTKDHRRTEMWLYLPEESRPPQAYAQWASATVLRETYLKFAQWTAGVAIGMWVLALLFSLASR